MPCFFSYAFFYLRFGVAFVLVYLPLNSGGHCRTNGWLVLSAAVAPRPHLVPPPVGLGLRVGSPSREPLPPPLRRWDEPRSHPQIPGKATSPILLLRRPISRFLNTGPTTPCKPPTRQGTKESRQTYSISITQPKLPHPASFKASIGEGD